MKSILKFSLILVAAAALAACRAESRKLEAPLTPQEKQVQNAAVQNFDVTPKVDILIVVDYSTSMTRHQANLAANIEQFVNEFSKNVLIDFHIAVLPMYDHVHCVAPGQAQVVPNGFPVGTCYPYGELLPLRNPNYKADSTLDNEKNLELPGQRFVTKSTPGYIEILKRTILMGEKPGPAYEEMFSPIIPALTDPSLTQGPNKDFYRAGALLVTAIITDGDDSDNPGFSITAGQMASALFELKNNDRSLLSTVAVVSPSGVTCDKDQSAPNGPKKIENLIGLTGGEILSLCSKDFGKRLAKIGADISIKVGQQKITLASAPDFNPSKEFELYFGSQKLRRSKAPDFEDGWQFDPETQTIYVGSRTKLNSSPDSKLSVRYTPVTLSSAQNGKVQSLR